jgi:hypothetical protein
LVRGAYQRCCRNHIELDHEHLDIYHIYDRQHYIFHDFVDDGALSRRDGRSDCCGFNGAYGRRARF